MSTVDIPKQGWGGVVVNEGPDFHVEVTKLDVPEPSKHSTAMKKTPLTLC